MTESRVIRLTITLIAALTILGSAHASTLDFDCDTMPNHSSSVSQTTDGPGATLTGTIRIVEKRRGRFLPLAGVLLSPANTEPNKSGNFVGFQIAATRDGAATSDVTFRDHGPSDVITAVTQLADEGDKRFSLSLSPRGALTLNLDGKAYTMDVPRTAQWSRVRVDLMCSTGQFKFFDVALSSSVGN